MSTIDDRLADARRGWTRLSAPDAERARRRGALLVDTRTAEQRATQGDLPGAIVIDRTVLEWRLDPTSDHRIPEADPGVTVVVACRQGFSSSLAARSLRDLGVEATDIIDGVEAWIAAGLPLLHGEQADVRH